MISKKKKRQSENYDKDKYIHATVHIDKRREDL